MNLSRAIAQQGQDTYECRVIKDPESGEPLKLRIQKIDLADLTIMKLVPFEDIASETIGGKKGGKAAQKARELALAQAAEKLGEAVEELSKDQGAVALSIEVVDLGCPDLRGQIKASDDECEIDPETKERIEATWRDMGEDFPGLVAAILELSGIDKGGVLRARRFPGRRRQRKTA